MKTSKVLVAVTFFVGALWGCAGRDSTVQTVSAGNLSLLKAQAVTDVYFTPFDLSGVKLEGDHGDAKAEENKQKWFTHVVAGAQRYFDSSAGTHASAILTGRASDAYADDVMQKGKVRFKLAEQAPPGALVVGGKYLYSRNIAGASRFFLGMMSGKSWNRAEVTISRGGDVVYSATLDGKFLGGGYSWGYETFAVNEGLGAGIAEIIWKLQRGAPVDVRK